MLFRRNHILIITCMAVSSWPINGQVADNTIQNEASEDIFFETIPSFRLPRNLRPTEYFVRILPHEMGQLSFEGHVDIILKVVERSTEVFLHQGFDLTLKNETVKVIRSDSGLKEDLQILDNFYTPESQIASYKLNRDLNVGDTVMFSTFFSGLMVTNTQGLNHFEYINKNGIKERILSTYFQPCGARLVFPCLDEPDMKAKFTLQVARRDGEIVLSNLIVNQTIISEKSSFTWIEFEKSVQMSTYLLAFVVCDFDKVQRRTKNQKLVRVWGRPETLEMAVQTADLAAEVLGWYEAYTAVNYPLRKLDIVTLETYPVSGMENFGIIIAREVPSANNKLTRNMWVSTVIAHEIAHQWAGNLVTPMWWSEFWLSEGIATYMAALALDELHPLLQAMNHLTADTISMVKGSDRLDEASTLLQPQFNPLISQLRDINIYYKGAAIIRMIESIVGRENFKRGMRKYFSNYKFLSVMQKEFFSSFELDSNEATPEQLHVIMETWTETKSYPTVTVERDSDNQLSVKQWVFGKHPILEDKADHPPENESLWWVPISLASSTNPDFSNKKPKLWIPPSAQTVSLKELVRPNDTWIILNVQQSAYIRVNYDTSTWKAISKQLYEDHTVIHLLNRAQLIDDAFNLFNNGNLNASVAFELISYLSKERSYFPYKSLFDNLDTIELMLRGEPSYLNFQHYILSLITPLLSESLGDDHVNKKLKSYILSWSCVLRHPQCLKMALSQFQQWKISYDDSIFSDFTTDSFLCAAVEAGGDGEWEVVYNQYLSRLNSTSKLKDPLMKALSCTQSEFIILRYFELIQSSSNGLTVEEARSIFNSLVRSHRWNDLTWTYLISKMPSLRKRFEADPVPFVTTVKDLNYLKLLIESNHEMKDTSSNYYKDFLHESEETARVTKALTSQVTVWFKGASRSLKQLDFVDANIKINIM